MDTILSRLSESFDKKHLRMRSRKNTQVLYQRIFNLIKDAILNNDIPEGSILPSTRNVAFELKVSRSSIIKAYELLLKE